MSENQKTVAAFFLGLVAVVVGCVLRGVVLVKLWAWFVMPIGACAISPATAIGLGLTLSFLLMVPQKKVKDAEPLVIALKGLLEATLGPLTAFALGYAVHCFQ